MIDVKDLRDDHKREQYRDVLCKRSGDCGGEHEHELLDAWREIDRNLTKRIGECQDLQTQMNERSDEIGEAYRTGKQEVGDALREQVAELKEEKRKAELQEGVCLGERDRASMALPNWLDDRVPHGRGEEDNRVEYHWGDEFKTEGENHFDLNLGIDINAGARLAGSRFAVLRGHAAKLHRALGQFMLDNAEDHGFENTQVPLIVDDAMMVGTGQYPKFVQDSYALAGGQSLIPTAEVSLANLYREQVTPFDGPIRLTALTPCFRSEAGAAGRDTRGLIRQHQFEKVELVTLCREEEAKEEHGRIVACAENVLQKLKLPYRRVLLCSVDTGFAARITYDLEVWMAGAGEYREISSCSDCGDFQARRMGAWLRVDGEKELFNTLNGSALAVGRALAAVVETYGEEIPEVLKPYIRP